MRVSLVCLCVLMSFSGACRKRDASPPGASPGPAARPGPGAGAGGAAVQPPGGAKTAAAPAASQPATPSTQKEDLAAFAAGALIVEEPDPRATTHASWLLRGPYETEQFWGVDKATNQSVVIELPERSLIEQLEFDTAMVPGAAKDVTVELSDKSAKEGFTRLADVSLKERADRQVFPVAARVPGRWLRLGVKTSYAPSSAGIGRFRALGRRLAATSTPDATGTYATRNGDLHIRQEGTSVVGCYEEHGGTFAGGMEGRVMKVTWHEKVQEHPEGAAFMVFSDDTQRFAGLFSYQGEDPNTGRFWIGTRKSRDVGTCPDWIGDVEKQMAKDLEEQGRVRVYGINFDSDSDHLRDESKPTLEHIAAMLKARPQWKVTLEGHTDSTSTPQHNQDLAERRASSVRRYLQSAGIAAERLRTAGLGATKPISSNDTALGRAQNRRVELVRE